MFQFPPNRAMNITFVMSPCYSVSSKVTISNVIRILKRYVMIRNSMCCVKCSSVTPEKLVKAPFWYL